MTYIISLDPAKLRDWCALSAVDMQYVATKKRFQYDVVTIARKQGLDYPDMVDWVIGILKMKQFNESEPPKFVMDATGVGVAVSDMFKAKGIRHHAITFTKGNICKREGSHIHVGKPRLVGKFLGAFDAGKVRVNPGQPLWPQMEREMLAFKAEMKENGYSKFEAEEGENDDLLISLAQAVWYGEEILRGGKL